MFIPPFVNQHTMYRPVTWTTSPWPFDFGTWLMNTNQPYPTLTPLAVPSLADQPTDLNQRPDPRPPTLARSTSWDKRAPLQRVGSAWPCTSGLQVPGCHGMPWEVSVNNPTMGLLVSNGWLVDQFFHLFIGIKTANQFFHCVLVVPPWLMVLVPARNLWKDNTWRFLFSWGCRWAAMV